MSQRSPFDIIDGRLWQSGVCFVPSVHGKLAFALEARRAFLSRRFGAVAVELPDSLRPEVIEIARLLPVIHSITLEEYTGIHSVLTADPCDSIFEAIRLADAERTPLRFIDIETFDLDENDYNLPDEYAIKGLGFAKFTLALDPFIPKAPEESTSWRREASMARSLDALTIEFGEVLFVCGLRHGSEIARRLRDRDFRDADLPLPTGEGGAKRRVREVIPKSEESPMVVDIRAAHVDSLYFLLGEMPYLTYLYEKSRGNLSVEEFEQLDGIKELLLATRAEYQKANKESFYRVSISSFQNLLQFARNLTLLGGRLTPELYQLAVAAKGVSGSAFAAKLMEMAKYYPYLAIDSDYETLRATQSTIELNGEPADYFSRLPGSAKEWKRIKLDLEPPKEKQQEWQRSFNPHSTCSYPPEDDVIERFTDYVRARALKLAGIDLVRVEEFQASFKDGLDIRETMRNLHREKIYVREEPPSKGKVGAVVFIFEEDREDGRFPFKLTWDAEHDNESTLIFYATNYLEDFVGPQIARAFYGGALFIFPPKFVGDVWRDRRFRGAKSSMEKLVFAACLHSRDRYVAYVSANPPTKRMKEHAERHHRHLIYIPLSSFGKSTIQRLRYFHVLGGRKVRSWAQKYIR
ncbi:MAG: hypothetical protein NUW37_10340 [Planctomycetes bacterium]|nr:hypothetical protein [Planctomycetota bacterium]